MIKLIMLIFMLLITIMSGCIFSMNDDYGKENDGATYTISGRFIDKSGNPIAGLTVKLSGSGDGTAITDGSGNYVFVNVSTGSYTVTPGDTGHGPANILVSSGNVEVDTNKDGHGSSISGDYSCSGCHKH